MNRLYFILVLCALFSCRTEEKNKVVLTVPAKKQTPFVDSIPRKKFLTPIEYDKYRVDTFSGKGVNLNYSSNKTARRFRTAIKWSIDRFGINFAGHYNIARWGCGTSCISGAITDLKTGLVYDIPPAALDYEFKKDSRLLVIDPPDSEGFYELCSYCTGPKLWLWNENKKKFEKLRR